MGTYKKDSRVDGYFNSLPQWQQTVCRQVRDAVHTADREVQETIKRTFVPYFTLQGNICALRATKDHVNIFVYDPLAPDPDGLITQGQGNKTARSIQVYEGDKIDSSALERFFKSIIANNRAGGWRTLT